MTKETTWVQPNVPFVAAAATYPKGQEEQEEQEQGMKQPAAGSFVMMKNLVHRADLNGCVGFVVGGVDGRVHVKTASPTTLAVKIENVETVPQPPYDVWLCKCGKDAYFKGSTEEGWAKVRRTWKCPSCVRSGKQSYRDQQGARHVDIYVTLGGVVE